MMSSSFRLQFSRCVSLHFSCSWLRYSEPLSLSSLLERTIQSQQTLPQFEIRRSKLYYHDPSGVACSSLVLWVWGIIIPGGMSQGPIHSSRLGIMSTLSRSSVRLLLTSRHAIASDLSAAFSRDCKSRTTCALAHGTLFFYELRLFTACC